MARGSAIANTYLLPQAAPLYKQPIQEQPFQDEVGDPASGLQQIDGVTEDYFNKWAQLKSFARDVHENLGIDVRYTDPSIPESNRLHRIYLKALADLKSQGERLKTGQTMYQQSLQRGDLINADPRKQYFDELQPGNQVLPNELDPITTEANNKLQQLYFGNSVKEARQYYDDIKGRLLKMADQNPNQREYWKRQAEALTWPTKSEKEFAPYYERPDRNQGKVNSSGNFLKKVTNLTKGLSDTYKLSDEYFGPDGERVWVSNDFEGDKFGTGTILRWEYSPSTGQTNLVTKRSDGAIERVPMTGSDPLSISKGLTSENARHSAAGEYIEQYADEAGYYNEAGDINTEPLIRQDVDKRRDKMLKEEKANTTAAYRQQVSDELEKMEAGSFFGDEIEYPISKERKAKVYRGKKGWYIENIDDLFPGSDDASKTIRSMYGGEKPLTKTAVLDFLFKQGHGKLAQPKTAAPKTTTGTEVAPTKTISRATLRSLLGQPDYEGQTEESLVEYYKSNGYTIK